jgi:hypothetical protein
MSAATAAARLRVDSGAGRFWTAGNRTSITARLRGPQLRACSASAQVAQLVEHCTENAGVGGSIPPLGTTTLSKRVKIGTVW